jgi:hypothetical protein
MLRLNGSKTIAAAVVGGLALMAASISTAHADGWKGHGNGHGWGHGKGWKKHGHGGWDGGPTVIVRNGYYYAPPPRVYYAPPPVYYVPPPPVYYAAPPPVYYEPAPLLNLQFRL